MCVLRTTKWRVRRALRLLMLLKNVGRALPAIEGKRNGAAGFILGRHRLEACATNAQNHTVGCALGSIASGSQWVRKTENPKPKTIL